jgi:acid stress chaperone HdeB
MTRFRKPFGSAFVIASVCCVSAWNVPAKAQVVLEMSMVTCGQYMGQGRERQDLIAAWMSGYFNAAKNQSVLNLARFDRNRKAIEHYCKTHKPETLMSAIQRNAY